MLDPALLAPERVRGLRRREYEKLVALGVFGDERVELLRGVLVELSPQGVPHARIAGWLAHFFSAQLEIGRYDVRGHSPYVASDDSMPEPDVSVALRTVRGGHPREALLLIEVSESSLAKDRSVKTEIYAEAGVPEYWIVNVRSRTVEVLTRPSPTGYCRKSLRVAGEVLHPVKLRNVALRVADIPWAARKRTARTRR
ncbi:MAG: Uma2 family endonuclease [Deltaproteobacteria bacterium]|nr:Uma2 family endonuclease [Deltaproteobacteria bacterium]